MKSYERCPRLYNELRTPGNHQSPGGPSYVAQFQCVKERDHADTHQYLPWMYRRERA